MTIIRNGNGDVINDENPLQVKLLASDIILPTDNQSKLAQTIQTHNAVSIPASGSSLQSSWMDADGFSDLHVTVTKDAVTTSAINVYWSTDGVSNSGANYTILSNGDNLQGVTVPIRGRYCRVHLSNSDAALAHTFSAWAYLTV